MNFSIGGLVVLVDRTLKGGDEIMFDGAPVTFPPGEIKLTVPREFVAWLYRTDKKRVWTTEGQWVHRYAVENPPPWLVDECGPEVGDCSPIEVDTTKLEGWDTTGIRREGTKLVNHAIPPSELRERLGAGSHVGAR